MAADTVWYPCGILDVAADDIALGVNSLGAGVDRTRIIDAGEFPLSQQEAMGAARAVYVRTDHYTFRVHAPTRGGRGARIIECDEPVLCRGGPRQKSERTEDAESCVSRHLSPLSFRAASVLRFWPAHL